MGKRKILLLLLFLAASLASLSLGAVALTPGQLLSALREGPGSTAGAIFWYVRLPRTLACLLSGAGLSVAGAVIQNVLRNPLASPSILGVNAGAGLAVTACCAAGILSGWAVALAAFLGALGAVLLIVTAAEGAGASRTTVILGGVAVNACLNALAEALTVLVPEAGLLAGDFRVGGFSAVAPSRLIPAGVLILLALLAVFQLHNELDLLALGWEMAQGLGLSVKAVRRLLLVLAALLAGASVSFAGLLGFVGLLVPHGLRRFFGSENRVLLPACALGGGAFVAGCDTLSRVVFAPYELPVGIVLSLLGGPFFLALLLRRKGGRADA